MNTKPWDLCPPVDILGDPCLLHLGWLIKTMGSSHQLTIHLLSLPPSHVIPVFLLFLYPCLPSFSWYLSRSPLHPTSPAPNLPRTQRLLAHSRPSPPRPSTGITSYGSLSFSVQGSNVPFNSRIKPTLTTASAGVSTVIIDVIRRPRINSHSARPLFSTRSMVSTYPPPDFPPETVVRARAPHASWGL